jgi:NAD(P)-dependent dehydrogenase (short-subunit alcohol dehydrogenase family)
MARQRSTTTRAPAAAAMPALAERVVLVTGGAQGIGRGIAEAVLAAGGRVLIGDRDAEAGAECIDDWQAGERARFIALDVSREASVRRFVATAKRAFGRIDGLVNNAGLADPEAGPVESLALADWNRWIATNLTGAFLTVKHALPLLKKAKGSIVNIASTRALQSEPDTIAYAASKGGLVALTHALAVSVGPAVRVNCVSPGWIAVGAWKKRSERKPERLSREDDAQHPAGRVGTPEDVGALCVYLLSAQSGFMTGANVVLDGGMTRKMQYA